MDEKSYGCFTEQELLTIEGKAEELAGTKGTNSYWVRAYLDLAYAADRLHAMIRRTIVK